MKKNNSNSGFSISQTQTNSNIAGGIRKVQNIVLVGSLILYCYSKTGEKLGFLKSETARKYDRVAVNGFFISVTPTICRKVGENKLLDNIADSILKFSSNAISNI